MTSTLYVPVGSVSPLAAALNTVVASSSRAFVRFVHALLRESRIGWSGGLLRPVLLRQEASGASVQRKYASTSISVISEIEMVLLL